MMCLPNGIPPATMASASSPVIRQKVASVRVRTVIGQGSPVSGMRPIQEPTWSVVPLCTSAPSSVREMAMLPEDRKWNPPSRSPSLTTTTPAAAPTSSP